MSRAGAVALTLAAIVGATAGLAAAQPTDVRVAPGDGELQIQWTEVEPGATHDVFLAAEPGVLADTVDSLALGRAVRGASSPLTVRGLELNRDYYIVVAEQSGSGPLHSAEVVGAPRGTWASVEADTGFVSVVADPVATGVLLASGVAPGGCLGAGKILGCDIYRSADGGLTWTITSAGNDFIEIRGLAIRGGTAIAMSRDVGAGEQILRSNDGGVTFGAVAMPLPLAFADRALAFDPVNPLVIYAGNVDLGRVAGQSLIIKSLDGGASWDHLPEVAGGVLNARALAVDPASTDTVWLGGGGVPRLARSTDGGAGWSEVVIIGLAAVSSILIDDNNPTHMWLGAGSDVLRSADGGDAFNASAIGLEGTVRALARDSAASILYVATTRGVFESRDDGASFALIGSGLSGDVLSLAYSREPEALVAATAAGLLQLDLTPPVPLEPLVDAGVDVGNGGGDGGCGCRSGGGTRSGAALLLVVCLVAGSRRREPSAR